MYDLKSNPAGVPGQNSKVDSKEAVALYENGHRPGLSSCLSSFRLLDELLKQRDPGSINASLAPTTRVRRQLRAGSGSFLLGDLKGMLEALGSCRVSGTRWRGRGNGGWCLRGESLRRRLKGVVNELLVFLG